jgi:hypothetical protein
MANFLSWIALAVSIHAFHSIFARRLAVKVCRARYVRD